MSAFTGQPAVLRFPGYPDWGLFFCACWLGLMKNGTPLLPDHIEAALTVEKPRDGHAVSCGVHDCRSTWVFREASQDWLRLVNDVEVPMPGPLRRSLYLEGWASEASGAEIGMSAMERRALYEEGTANDAFDAEAAAGDTEMDLSTR